MWILTTFGFFSAVTAKEPGTVGMLSIRARVKSDLETLRERYIPEAGEVVELPARDYPARLYVTREQWAEALRCAALDIDYSNFKDEVTRQQGRERHDIYTRVWGVLLSLERRAQRPPAGRFYEKSDSYYEDIFGTEARGGYSTTRPVRRKGGGSDFRDFGSYPFDGDPMDDERSRVENADVPPPYESTRERRARRKKHRMD